jgi:hypothetical protein
MTVDVVPLPAGPVCGMSAEQWDAAVTAGRVPVEVRDRVTDAARESRREVRAARRHYNHGRISQVDYDDVREQSRRLCRRAIDAGGVL